MKTIICVLSLVFALSLSNAQTASNSKVSISYSSDEPGEDNYRVNISISNTEDMYTLKASFPLSKTGKLKQFLKDHLTPEMTKNGTTSTWKYNTKGETGYVVKLKRGKLNVFMDKEFVSADVVEDLIDMFSDLKDIVKE
ncbi:hypothetical protein [Aquimarina macrocephali]|uniref:hypothetical protein n=1 Tax=Aquimarina macrocephali TaxID=666563 RepID=UPI000465F9A3|nr:hypothetical protein [Aquimarina macrocephali]